MMIEKKDIKFTTRRGHKEPLSRQIEEAAQSLWIMDHALASNGGTQGLDPTKDIKLTTR